MHSFIPALPNQYLLLHGCLEEAVRDVMGTPHSARQNVSVLDAGQERQCGDVLLSQRGAACAGIVFTVCCEPYLESEYGSDYISETPVKLLDRLLYGQREHIDEEVSHQMTQHR